MKGNHDAYKPKLSGVLIVNGKLLQHPQEVLTYEGHVFVVDAEEGKHQVYPLQRKETPQSQEEPDAKTVQMRVWQTVQRIRREMTGLPFDKAAPKMIEILRSEFPQLEVRQSRFYGDVLVQTEKGRGIVALFNESARTPVQTAGSMDGKPPLPPDPERFADRITGALADGWTVVVEGEMIVILPFPLKDLVRSMKLILGRRWHFWLDVIRRHWIPIIPALDVLMDIVENELPPRRFPDQWSVELLPIPINWSVIFCPHEKWQRESVGFSSSHPLDMAFGLARLGLCAAIYLNGAASVRAWHKWLQGFIHDDYFFDLDLFGLDILSHSELNPRLIYNLGHGDIDIICCKDGLVDEFFDNDFVRSEARLDRAAYQAILAEHNVTLPDLSHMNNAKVHEHQKPLVYIHSCLTANYESDMPQAFIDSGAATYVGWRWKTAADSWYCDCIDRRFWLPLMIGGQQVSVAEWQAIEFEAETGWEYNNFKVVGSRSWQLPKQILARLPVASLEVLEHHQQLRR